MRDTVTKKQVLRNEQQYHSITTMPAPTNVRGFVCAATQHLKAYISPDVRFNYQWVRLPNGVVQFALSGSRSVQDVFKAYLINNRGRTLASAEYVSYGRNNTAFHRAFSEYFDQRKSPHGFGCGGSK